jgi:hypothetical protein
MGTVYIGRVNDWTTTAGGIQVTLIDGVKYATVFDLATLGNPRGRRVRFMKTGQRNESYGLPEVDILEILGEPQGRPPLAAPIKERLREFRIEHALRIEEGIPYDDPSRFRSVMRDAGVRMTRRSSEQTIARALREMRDQVRNASLDQLVTYESEWSGQGKLGGFRLG